MTSKIRQSYNIDPQFRASTHKIYHLPDRFITGNGGTIVGAQIEDITVKVTKLPNGQEKVLVTALITPLGYHTNPAPQGQIRFYDTPDTTQPPITFIDLNGNQADYMSLDGTFLQVVCETPRTAANTQFVRGIFDSFVAAKLDWLGGSLDQC